MIHIRNLWNMSIGLLRSRKKMNETGPIYIGLKQDFLLNPNCGKRNKEVKIKMCEKLTL